MTDLPQVGQVYEFDYSFEGKTITDTFCVVGVTDEHVIYKLRHNRCPYPMTHGVWRKQDYRLIAASVLKDGEKE